MLMVINSPKNERIKQVVRLCRASERRKSGLFLIEGRQELQMALAAGIKIETLFVREGVEYRVKSNGRRAIKLIEVAEKAFKKISYRQHPDGVLAIARIPAAREIRLSSRHNPLILVADSLEKPGNLGAILRTADAAGADLVLVTNSQVDLYNPNVIRASLGTIFTVHPRLISREEAIGWLKNRRIKIVVATPNATKNYWQFNYRQPVALVVGAEHEGVSAEWLAAAHQRVVIPMRGNIDSLNVSVSAAVIVFEALRQRNN